MIRLIAPAAFVMLASGLGLGALAFTPVAPFGRVTWGLAFLATSAALPAILWWVVVRAQHATTDQLADSHTRGYQLALEHVALGLLDRPAPEPPGKPVMDVLATVHHLRITSIDRDRDHQRQAE